MFGKRKPSGNIEFIPNAGIAMTTGNVVDRVAPIRWMKRDTPHNPQDNGWRVFSAADTSEYLADTSNWQLVDYNLLCNLEPLLVETYNYPTGSDLEIRRDDRIRLFDATTDREIPLTEG